MCLTGQTSANWTLEAQIKRDVRVMDLVAKIASRKESLAHIQQQIQSLETGRQPQGFLFTCELQELYTLQDKFMTEIPNLSKQLKIIKRMVFEDLLAKARAVLCTVDTAGQLHQERYAACTSRLYMVLLDEAGTVSESKMTLLASLNVQQITAIGDHKQLSCFTQALPYDINVPLGFFQRLQKAPVSKDIPMLRTQYRMHPEICNFVSGTFYNRLLSTPGVQERKRV